MKSRQPLLEGSVPWPEAAARQYVERGFWRGVSLDSILTESLPHRGNRLAVVCGTRRVSYADLNERVTRRALALWERGLRPADCVVVQLPNCLEAVETYFALFRMGAVPVLALPGHREAEVTGFVRHTQAIAYLYDSTCGNYDYLELAQRIMLTERSLKHLIDVSDAKELASAAHSTAEYSPPEGHEIALLQLSGGSTGDPKLIPRTHDDYLYSIETSARACGYSENTVALVVLPLAHNFPMSSPGFLGCLSSGGTVVLCPDPSVEAAFFCLHRDGVTDVALVPPLAQAWVIAKRMRGESFPSLETIQVGGAKLDPILAQEIREEFSCQLQQVFGMAEGLVCNTNRHALLEQIISTQGVPMSEADEIRIVDDHDEPVADGTVGHLLTRGPYTIRGYFRAPAANQDAFTHDGFYRTGDLVLRRADNHLVVQGRAKEIINRGGEKISPSEVEHCFLTHSLVREVAVVGQKDKLLGERICAFVVLQPEAKITRETLVAHLRQSGLATFKIPDRVEFIESFPRTRVGKVDKRSLSRMPPVVTAPLSLPSKELSLRAELAALLEVDAASISNTDNLLECGLDSIRIMILVERFREWGHDISFIEIAEQPSLDALDHLLATSRRLAAG